MLFQISPKTVISQLRWSLPAGVVSVALTVVTWVLGWIMVYAYVIGTQYNDPPAILGYTVFTLAVAFVLGVGAVNSAAMYCLLIGRYSGKAEPGLKGSFRYMRARFKATVKSLVPGTAVQVVCFVAFDSLYSSRARIAAAILALATVAWVFAWALNSVAPAYSALSDAPDSQTRFRRETMWGAKLTPHALMLIGGFMVLVWLVVEPRYPLSLYSAAAWSPGLLVLVSPALIFFLGADTIALPALLSVMLAASIVNPALACLLVRRVPH